MTTVQAIILGVVEGFTEFLPISSTGHMILVSHFLHIIDSATLVTFEIVVQLGAIFAVVATYHKKLFKRELKLKKQLLIGNENSFDNISQNTRILSTFIFAVST